MSKHDDHDMHENSLRAHREERQSGAFATRAKLIENMVRESGRSLTDRQVRDALGFRDMNDVRPRINELIAKGVLEECGQVRDKETDKMVRLVRIKVSDGAPVQEELFA